MTHHIQKMFDFIVKRDILTILYEDNITCTTQLKEEYFKEDKTKHIS